MSNLKGCFVCLIAANIIAASAASADESRFNAPPGLSATGAAAPVAAPSPAAPAVTTPAPSFPNAGSPVPSAANAAGAISDRSPAQQTQPSIPNGPGAENPGMAPMSPPPPPPMGGPTNGALFNDANYFSFNQATELKSRSAPEQVEILTRYLAIQSEQIKALKEEIERNRPPNPMAHQAPPMGADRMPSSMPGAAPAFPQTPQQQAPVATPSTNNVMNNMAPALPTATPPSAPSIH